MRVQICAVGRLRSGPEAALIDDYQTRFDRTGRALSLGPLDIREVDDRKGGGMSAQADLLERAIPDGAFLVTLDERGKLLSSPDFAAHIAKWRDDGHSDLSFVIGGADGIDPSLRTKADFSISFGKMVWPHMMVRAMLCEQLYRASSILAGGPYHRA